MLRTLYLPAILLGMYCAAMQAMPTGTVPARSLDAEMARADQARTVPIHTDFASGEALFFADTGTVLAARHALLTPSSDFADKITIAVALPPLENMEELTSTPIAQDRDRDLVLLRVENYKDPLPTKAAAAGGVAAIPPCEPVQNGSVAGERSTGTRRGVSHRRRGSHTRHHTRTADLQGSVQTRVVWDGPIAH